MASGAPSKFSQYKTNYNRYVECVKVIATREIHRVFQWLYKGGDKYVADFITDTQDKGINVIRLNKNIKKLNKKIPTEKMDITLLYDVMQYTCGLSTAEDAIWYAPSETQKDSLEHTLYNLKEHRNDIGHEDNILRELPDHELVLKMDEVCDLCRILLMKAGEICGSLQDASTAIIRMEQDLKKFMGIKPKDIADLGRQEKLKQYQDSGLDMSYYSMPLMYHKENQLQLVDFFRVILDDDYRSPVIILRGDAGTGKSTLCQFLDWSWTTEQTDIPGIKLFDLLLPINCQDVCDRDMKSLLQEMLPETILYCGLNETVRLLKQLNVLWIIDSLEEATSEATDLLRKLMKTQNTNHTFVIASRNEHIYSVTRDIDQYEYTEITLHGVEPKEMIEMLVYSQHCDQFSVELGSMLSNYDELSDDLKKEFHNPLKLTYAMKNWEEVCRLNKGFSLIELYEIIQNAQQLSLAKKLTYGRVKKMMQKEE